MSYGNRGQSGRSKSSRPGYGPGGKQGWGGKSFSSFRGGGNRGGFKVKNFDPSALVRGLVPSEEIVEEVYVPKHKFADFKLPEQLHKNIEARGYTTPTPIQDETIPALLEGRDLVGIAQTGTGKTAAFLLPLIAKTFWNKDEQVLIIAPTRELAVQIDAEFRLFAQGMHISSVVCIGGVRINPQISRLRQHPQFVIGTPGRLCDVADQGVLRFGDFGNVVLDEVDQMLDMGFIQDIRFIASKLKTPRQSLFFSATMPENVQSVMRSFLQDPIRVSIKSKDMVSTIAQDIVRTEGKSKLEVLQDMLTKDEFEKVLVFVRTKRGAEKLSRSLYDRNIENASIHGNKTQSQRQRAINDFKHEAVRVLIATDVASRGLDIEDVSHVINFDLPETYEDYVHRIGRTGRANKRGIALTLID